MLKTKEKIQYAFILCADFLSLALSALLAWLILDGGLHVLLDYTPQEVFEFGATLALSCLVVALWFNRSRGVDRRSVVAELGVSIQSNVGLAAVWAVMLIVTKVRMLESRYLYVGILGINVLMMFLFHMAIKRYLRREFYKGTYASLVGVITTSDRAEALIEDIKKDWTKKLEGLALIDGEKNEMGRRVSGCPVMARYEDFMSWVRLASLDEVYISLPYQTGDSLRPVISELESMGLTIHLNVPALERYAPGHREESWLPHLQPLLDTLGGVPMATLAVTRRTMSDVVLKRIMDIVGALVGLVISVPIILVTAIPLKLESPGPLFFSQTRVGLNGRQFKIYKLRSMYRDAEQRKRELMDKNKMEGLMFKVDDDPRITRVGRFIRKTSIDELPQFWNVLKGEMSLVGTRPPTLDEYERYESHHKRRLSMKPGITGLWQVSGRSDVINFEEIVQMDVSYIDNWSLLLDMKILLRTVAVVFAGKGAE